MNLWDFQNEQYNEEPLPFGIIEVDDYGRDKKSKQNDIDSDERGIFPNIIRNTSRYLQMKHNSKEKKILE